MKKKTGIFTKILIIILVLEIIALLGIFAVFKFLHSPAAMPSDSVNSKDSSIEESADNYSADKEHNANSDDVQTIISSDSDSQPDSSDADPDTSLNVSDSTLQNNSEPKSNSSDTDTSNIKNLQRKSHSDSEKNPADQINLNVNVVYQLPELPTGCEITSLDMVLNYFGYDIGKEELSDNYLDKGTIGVDSYKKVFLGNPRDASAYGCFAPVIVNAANKYLSEKNSELHAYDVTGTELNELFENIRYGLPVIIWGSLNPNINITYHSTWIVDSEILKWPANEHCMVLTGFDLTNNTVTINDPLKGVCTYDYNAFLEYYVELGRQAVVIDYHS